MNVAVAFGKSATVADLNSLTIEAKALYYLASKNVPEEVRAEAVKLAKSQPVTLTVAKRLHGRERKLKPEHAHAVKVVTISQRERVVKADDGGLRLVPVTMTPTPVPESGLPCAPAPKSLEDELTEIRQQLQVLRKEIQRRRKENHDAREKRNWNPDQVIKAEQTAILDFVEQQLDQIALQLQLG